MPKKMYRLGGRLRWQDLRQPENAETLALVGDVLRRHAHFVAVAARIYGTDAAGIREAAAAGSIDPIPSPARPDLARTFPTKAERGAARFLDGLSRSASWADRDLWAAEKPWREAVDSMIKALDKFLADRGEDSLTPAEFEGFMDHASPSREQIDTLTGEAGLARISKY